LQPIKFGVGVLENKRTKRKRIVMQKAKIHSKKLMYEKKKDEMNDEKGTKL
jgi:hypothetical protein